MTRFLGHKHSQHGSSNVAVAATDMRLASFNHDGAVLTRSSAQSKRSIGLPLRELMPLFAIFILFRVIIAADMGAAGYGQKVEALSQGNLIERSVAVVMPLDPVSENASKGLRKVMAFVSGL